MHPYSYDSCKREVMIFVINIVEFHDCEYSQDEFRPDGVQDGHLVFPSATLRA
jgi:hypothetical protein